MTKLLVEIRVEVWLKNVVEDGFLALFLGLERLGIVEHFAVPIAKNVGRVPTLDAEKPRLEPWRDDSLHPGLTGLQVLASHRCTGGGREFEKRGNVGAQIRRRVGVRDAFLDGSIRVDHARGDCRIAGLEALLERRDAGMDGALGEIDLGAAAPNHHQSIETVFLLESAHVLAQRVGHLALVGALLHVGTVEALDVAAIEDRRHRTNLFDSTAPDRAAPARALQQSWPPRKSCLRKCPTRQTQRRQVTRAERSP